MEKFRKRYGISSKLQEDILSYICRNSDGTYDILSRHTNRNERTIGKSVQTLKQNFYVERQVIKEGKNRSKFIVIPTFKGLFYGLAYLNIHFDEILRAYFDENEQSSFLGHIQKIRDYKLRQEYSNEIARLCFEYNLFNGGIPAVTDKEGFTDLGFEIGVSEAIRNKSNSVSCIAEQGTDIVNEIFEPREIQDFKNFWWQEDASLRTLSKEWV